MGYRVDKNAHIFPEGLFLLEIVGCEDKVSRAGDGKFNVKLRDTKTGRTFYDGWMMEGNGVKHTIPKLEAIGLNMDDEIEAHDLLDKQFIARVKHKESPGFDTRAEVAKAWPTSRPPKEWTDANPEEGSPDPFDGKPEPKTGPVSDDEVPW